MGEDAKAIIWGGITTYSSWEKRKRKTNTAVENKIKKLWEEHEHYDQKICRLNCMQPKKYWVLCGQTYHGNNPKALKTLAFTLEKQRGESAVATIMDKTPTYQKGKLNALCTYRPEVQDLDTLTKLPRIHLEWLSSPLVTNIQNDDWIHCYYCCTQRQ